MMLFFIILILITVPTLLAAYAQIRINQVFTKYHSIPNKQGINGLEVAEYLLHHLGLHDVEVELIRGRFTDRYNPDSNVLGLSQTTAHSNSVAAMGIVAHEIGHALQDQQNYSLLRLRSGLARRMAIVVQWLPFVLVWGILFGANILLVAAVGIIAIQVIFAFLALPVERNASARALDLLVETEMVTSTERREIDEVLRAAVFTYIVATGQRMAFFIIVTLVVLVLLGL